MEIEKQEWQIEHTLLSKQHDNSDVIIISDDEDEEEEEATLEPKKKKPMLWSPRDNVDAFDELSKEVNDVFASIADFWFSEKNVVESTTTTNKGYGHVSLDDLGVSVEDLKSVPWEAFDPTWEIRSWANDPWLGGHIEDMFSPPNYSDT